MKKTLTIMAVIMIAVLSWAQSPQKMSYQAVVRNGSNQLVTSQGIGMRISILQGSETGTEVFKEIYNPNPETNANGLVTLEIGTGVPLTGTFAAIDWADGPLFIKTETDPTGGTNYTITAISQLLSVPYSFHTKTAENLTGTITESQVSDLKAYLTEETDPGIAKNFDFTGAVIGDLLQFDGEKWIKLTPDYAAVSHSHAAAEIVSGILAISRGGTNTSAIGGAGSVAYSTGSAHAFTGVGNSGQILVSAGTGTPGWTNSPTVQAINYSIPRIHYQTVGESSFRPRWGNERVDFGWGMGGAYLTGTVTAGGGLVAEVDVPVGAKITEIDIGFYDADPNNRLYFSVMGQNILGTSAYVSIGSVSTNTSSGYGYVSLTGFSYTVSRDYKLWIRVLSETNAGMSVVWPGSNLRVTGARVKYEIVQAF